MENWNDGAMGGWSNEAGRVGPVRTGLVERGGRLEDFPWSSLREYVMPPGRRSAWMSVERGMSVVGMPDNASGRRKYLERLVMQVQASKPRRAGLVNVKEAIHSETAMRWTGSEMC